MNLVVDATQEMSCPNGVSLMKNGHLLIGEFFFGNILEANNGKLKIIASGYRGADGVEQDSKGALYVSSWTQGKLWKMNKDGSGAEVLIEGLQSAADFYLDEKAHQIWLPDMLAGTVTVLPLN